MVTLAERPFGTSAATHTIDFTGDGEVYVATHVRIRLPTQGVSLSLAEVEVMGYVSYPYSELDYTRKCPRLCVSL